MPSTTALRQLCFLITQCNTITTFPSWMNEKMEISSLWLSYHTLAFTLRYLGSLPSVGWYIASYIYISIVSCLNQLDEEPARAAGSFFGNLPCRFQRNKVVCGMLRNWCHICENPMNREGNCLAAQSWTVVTQKWRGRWRGGFYMAVSCSHPHFPWKVGPGRSLLHCMC